ncbi:MAG: hypothetical protein EBT17_05015 [Actinobacteria bacterium]|nr:hypothetical protein [Actinomycetota bacterium]
MKEKLYNLLYKGRIIHKNLTAEDCGEILQDLSEQFYEVQMVLNPIPKILDRVMEEIQSTLQPAEINLVNHVEGKVSR